MSAPKSTNNFRSSWPKCSRCNWPVSPATIQNGMCSACNDPEMRELCRKIAKQEQAMTFMEREERCRMALSAYDRRPIPVPPTYAEKWLNDGWERIDGIRKRGGPHKGRSE